MHAPRFAERLERLLFGLYKSLHRGKRHLLVAPFPKSASLYFCHLLSKITGFPKVSIKCGKGWGHNCIHASALVDAMSRDNIIMQHLMPDDYNIDMLQSLGPQVLLIHRDIFDVVVSYRDHLVKRAGKEPLYTVPNGQLLSFTPERQLDYVVDMIMPWYIQFYAAWERVDPKRLSKQWIDYEQVTGEPVTALEMTVRFYGLDVTSERVKAVVAEHGLRQVNFNMGVTGRGRDALSSAQKARIRALTAYHPDIDFSRIGL